MTGAASDSVSGGSIDDSEDFLKPPKPQPLYVSNGMPSIDAACSSLNLGVSLKPCSHCIKICIQSRSGSSMSVMDSKGTAHSSGRMHGQYWRRPKNSPAWSYESRPKPPASSEREA